MARGPRIVAPGSAVRLPRGACSAGEGVELTGAGVADTGDCLRVAVAGEHDQLDPHGTRDCFSVRHYDDRTIHECAETVAPPGTGGTSPERRRTAREHLAACSRPPVAPAPGRGASPAAGARSGPARTAPWAGGPSGT